MALLALALAVPLAISGTPPAVADPPPPAGVDAVAAGGVHTCALRANGSVKCWGGNGAGQLGLGDTAAKGDEPDEMGGDLPAIDLGAGGTATAITAGNGHTCALLDNGIVKCWGDNTYGQLGLGDTADRGDANFEMGGYLPTVGLGRTATAITAGNGHTCALLDNGTVVCWGHNAAGQLGLGDTVNRGDSPGGSLTAVQLGAGRTATSVAAGDDHTCAVLDNGAVKCWGDNSFGQLGLGNHLNRGDGPGEMGDTLPAVQLGTGRTATSVAAGFRHTCAVLDDGSVKCWGDNANGKLGLGDTLGRGDRPAEMGDGLPAVQLGTGRTATSVVAGASHTCARLDDGTVKCWGADFAGQLGLGSTTTRGDAPGEMGDALPAVPLGTGRTASAIAGGDHHTCALEDDGNSKCWGYNDYGQLGLGDGARRGDGPGEMGDALPIVVLDASPVVAVSADEASVAAGGTIHLHLIVVSLGDQAVTNVVVDGGNAGGCDVVLPVLAAGAEQTIDCAHTTTGMDLPSFTATATAASTQTPTPASSSALTVPVTLSPSIGAIGGTITETGTGDPIADGLVALLSPADFSLVGYANARLDGTYSTIATPGNYFVYALDPAGAHRPGFLGAPTQITVTGGATAPADPTLAPAAGGFAGTVTDQGTGTPVNNVLVASLDTATATPGAGGLTAANGTYSVEPLPAGSRYAILADLSGAHAPEFYDDQPGIDTADLVTVGGATTPGIDAALTPATPPAGGALLEGAVTDAVTTQGLGDVAVIALHAADLRLAAGTISAPDGTWSLDLDPGDYKLELYDTTGTHAMEWHDDLPFTAIGEADSITAVAGAPTTVDADLDPTAGTADGTVTDVATAAPLRDVWVIAIGPTGTIRATTTDADGTWTITGLDPGDHRLRFVDPSGTHAPEYFDDSPSPDTATPRTITGGQTTTANASLAPTP